MPPLASDRLVRFARNTAGLALLGVFPSIYYEYKPAATTCAVAVLLLAFVTRQLSPIQSASGAAKNENLRRIPKIRGKWPGNLDVLMELVYSDARDYPTEVLSRWSETYGLTFDMGILWSSQIVTGKAPPNRTFPACPDIYGLSGCRCN